MSESKALTAHPSSDMENVTFTATDPSAVGGVQQMTLDWCRMKLSVVTEEHADLEAALAVAKERKWATAALSRARNRAAKRITFYEKVIYAMEAGYMIFPTTDCEIIAVRHDGSIKHDATVDRSFKPTTICCYCDTLPAGEGEYASRFTKNFYLDERTITIKRPDDSTYEAKRWDAWAIQPADVEFPLIAAKPELMSATAAAMELGIFDEIGLVNQRKGDPLIVGRVKDPTVPYEGKVLHFLIAWFVDTREL